MSKGIFKKDYGKRIELLCKFCNKKFHVIPSQKWRKTCSYNCRNNYLWAQKEYKEHMSLVHTEHGENNYRQKALKFYGKVCQKCNKKNGFFDVHHKDGNRRNNIISNLQVLCKSCHLILIWSGNHPVCKRINVGGLTYD